jgi:hypothetical protein
MSDDTELPPDQEFDPGVDAHSVTSRAEGRPSEEDSSDDPEAQAQAILEDSEERIAEGARSADPSAE